MIDPRAARPDLDDLPTRFAIAAGLLYEGRLDEAHAAFAQIVAEFPACHEGHYMLGRVALQRGDAPGAEEHLLRAEALDVGNPEFLLRLGQAQLAQGNVEGAADTFSRAVEEAGDDSGELMALYGRALVGSRRFEEAERALRRACELAPNDASLWSELAGTQQHLSHIDEADASLVRALAIEPGNASLHGQRALLLERANRLEGARIACEAALAIDAQHPTALVTRARLVRRTGDLAGARRDLEKAIGPAASPDHRRSACITLAQILDQLGEFDAAYARMVESKKPINEVPPSLREQGAQFLMYIEACRRQITRDVVKSWPEPPPEERESPVFFVGFPRSGTTLLEQMLAAHPGFVTTDERPSLPTVRQHLRNMVNSPSEIPATLSRLADAQVRHLRDVYWHDIDELFGILPAGVRVVDKHPLNTTNLALVRRLFPNAPVIMSLRDPRDVCVSCMMNLTRTPMSATLFQSFDTTTRFYAAVMDLWLHYRDVLGLRYIETRYEDVIADAATEVGRVLEFLGEPWDEAVLRFREQTAGKAIRSTSYEQVTQAIHGKAVGRWRNYERHMGDSIEVLMPYVRALGYD